MTRPDLRAVLLGAAFVGALAAPACTCNKKPEGEGSPAASGTPAVPSGELSSNPPPASSRFSAPIAAARVSGSSDVVVVGLDVASKAIRLQHVGASGEVKADRTVLEDVAWSSDADLKLFASAGGTSLVWRGKHHGKQGRTLVLLGADFTPRAGQKPIEVGAASCATQDAFVHADGKKIAAQLFASGAAAGAVDVPRDREVALACGAHRAFVVLEHDDGADLGVAETTAGDAGSISLAPAVATKPLLREGELGDEARERAEYVVGDELGVVRLSSGGALAWRETKDGKPGRLTKLKTTIPQDDDVVAVDASPRIVTVVYTEETEAGCPAGSSPKAKVMALRIDRATAADSVVELAAGSCGREIGPFYLAAAGDAVNVAWVERVPTAGKARPPIAALAHALVPVEGTAKGVARIDVEADALADAGCDATQCYAAALVRNPGTDGMVPGPITVLRYAP